MSNDLEQRIREAFSVASESDDVLQLSAREWFALGYKAALPRWIPVSERLPDDQQPVLIHRSTTRRQQEVDKEICSILQAAWDEDGQAWYDYQDDTDINERLFTVTHWMPLPDAPQPPEREERK